MNPQYDISPAVRRHLRATIKEWWNPKTSPIKPVEYSYDESGNISGVKINTLNSQKIN